VSRSLKAQQPAGSGTGTEGSRKIEGGLLAARIRELRKTSGLTLSQLAGRSGLAPSTISKIENNVISPTYGNLIRLAHGLDMDIVQLLTTPTEKRGTGRRSVTYKGEGKVYSLGSHDYELLCTDIAHRKMVPMLARVRAHSMEEVAGLNSHPGEEIMFIVSGKVELHTEFYAPLQLQPGDCVYLDSTMGHVALAAGAEEAVVFWVCSDERSVALLEGGGDPAP
jgi:transcriptional regulator with XRE-family HTH domain